MERPLLLLLFVLLIGKIAYRFNRLPLYSNPRRGRELLADWRRLPTLMHRNLGCSVETFDDLVSWLNAHSDLRDSRHMTIAERLAIFLFICRYNASQPLTQTVFSRGAWAVSNSFNSVLKALLPLYDEVVK